MSRKVRENVLVTYGNYAVFPGAREVFQSPDPIYGGPTIVPADGQLVIYDNQSGVSLDAVSVVDRFDITLGVAHDRNRDGIVDFIRKAAFDKVAKDYIFAYTAEPPRCAIQEVVDFLFTCTHCTQPYSITVTVEDNETQNQYPYNRPEAITFTANEECCSCDGCPDTSDVSCKLVQNLIDQMNGVLTTNPLQVPTFSRRIVPYEFTAVRLYGGEDSSQTFCFTPESSADCTTCDAVPFIESFEFDLMDGVGGISNPQTVTFTGNANPADGTQTLISQLPNIARQINIALNGRGSAILTRGVGKCCPINLEINSCAVDMVLNTTASTPIEPCSTSNPLEPFDVPAQCLNCGDPALAQATYDYGIRLIAKDVTVPDTTCFPPNPVKGILTRKINAYPSGGFSCGNSYVRKTQKAQFPENLGYQWQWREYTGANGGSGREHQAFNKNYGPLNLPGAETRAAAGFVNPNVSYCAYAIEHGLPHSGTGVSDPFRVARARTVVLIPENDGTTIASFESIFGAYALAGNNTVRAIATCGSDQDQVQNDVTTPTAVVEGYPDSNGMIY